MGCIFSRLTEDGGLAGIVQPQDQDSHLLGAEERLEEPREEEAHVLCGDQGVDMWS